MTERPTPPESSGKQKKGPLSDFSKLSDNIHLRQSTSSKNKNENDPSLVIICSWMGANLRHVQKYTLAYQRIYPSASILVIESTLLDMLLRPSRTQQSRIAAARDVVLAEQQQATANCKILVHVFSNGGVNTACQLATAVVAASSSGSKPQFAALVLDSCPGLSTHARTIKAVSASLPRGLVVRLAILAFVHLYLFLVALLTRFLGYETKVVWARRALLDEKLFALDTPRLYIYSKADEMIFWGDVQAHAGEARKGGYEAVFALPFEGGKHCAHVLEDEGRYWGAVERLVEGSEK